MTPQNGSPNFVPPPVPRPRRDAGFTWALVGCGGIILLFVIGIGMALYLSPKSGGIRQVFENAASASSNGERLIPVRQALTRYRTSHQGEYPETLKQLVPDYLTQEAWSLLEDKKVAYNRPSASADPEFPVVTLRGNTGDLLGQKQTTYTRLLKNDSIVMDQVTRTTLYRPGSTKADNPFSSKEQDSTEKSNDNN